MKRKRYVLLMSIFLLVLLVLLVGISGMNQASAKAKKAQVVNSSHRKIKNVGCENEELNPLYLDAYPQITEAVNDYYISQSEEQDYTDYYKDIKVYTKDGYYMGTYIVFARYDMKIRGIYTTVPGLETLYVNKDVDGNYRVSSTPEYEETKELVQTVAQHADVQALLAETSTDYEQAVASDALLGEMLEDLQNACY